MLAAIDCVVAPFDHRYVVPILEVRVWLLPEHIPTVPDGVIAGLDGNGLTVTTVVPDHTLRHPAAFVTRTV